MTKTEQPVSVRVRFLKQKIAKLEVKLERMEKEYRYDRFQDYPYFVRYKMKGPLNEFILYVSEWERKKKQLQDIIDLIGLNALEVDE